MKRLLTHLETLIAGILLPAIIFISFTPSIIADNQSDITFNRVALLTVWELFLAFSLLIAGAIFFMPAKAKRISIVILTCLSVNILAWNAVFAHVWLNSTIALIAAIALEFCGIALCLWIAWRMPFSLLRRVAAIFAILIGVTGAFQHEPLYRRLGLPTHSYNTDHQKNVAQIIPSDSRYSGNVYHIVLDAFSSQFLPYRMQQDPSINLAGYTYYPRANTNYGRTNLSMRGVFTGQFHQPGFGHWKRAFDDGFTKSLNENNVPLYYYPFYPYFCDQNAIFCHATFDLYDSYRNNVGRSFIIDALFLSTLPVSIRDVMLGSLEKERRNTEVWDYGFSLTNWMKSLFYNGEGYPKWRLPVQSVTMDTLADFLGSEASLPATGRYTYLHVMVPHGPMRFDPDCDFVPPGGTIVRSPSQTYDEQFSCAVTVIQKVTDRLRELGRFDNSLVIFHGDHGTYNAGKLAEWDSSFKFDPTIPTPDRNTTDDSLIPSQQIAAISNPLLLVHKPGQSDFETSNASFELIDIAPTILDFFKIDHASFPGTSIISSQPPADRIPTYFESDTDVLTKLHRMAKYARKDGVWTFDSWSKTDP